MLHSGIVSVTFRKLNTERIIELTKEADLEAVEWGGDIHVPHGAVETAEKVRNATEAAGLKVASYGSYYRVGTYEKPEEEFQRVLDSAVALGAPVIRVWAGDRGSETADEAWWQRVVKETREIADKALMSNIKIAFEYHGNTLTDNLNSVLRLLKSIYHENVFTYWQPNWNIAHSKRVESLKAVLPYLLNVHAFYWGVNEKFPLQDGMEYWKEYVDILKGSGKEHHIMLEFVKEDKEEQFLEDAAALLDLIKG